ncbi:hypothetical protein IQ03_00569 [Gemmobacter caeni]|nr:hypothetical protein [Gemmobacter caeni]TWJ05761.1 hypothetical protein IQ03_00569 [Gemmobacter caeni]
MSASDRQQIRASARAALQAGLTGWTEFFAWAQSVNAEHLPAWAVATPSERRSSASQDTAQRETSLVVVVKLLGGDLIEDDLDEAADQIEAAVVAALRASNLMCELTQSETRIDAEAVKRLGTLTMSFTVTYWTDDPA